MKLFKVIHVDSIIFLKKLPLILVAIVLCLASFIVALPPQLMQSGDIPKISIAFAYEGEDEDIVAIAVNFLSNIDAVENYYTVTHKEAEEMLESGKVDAAVGFPPDAMQRFVDGESFNIEVMAEDEFIGSFAYSLLDEVANSLNRIPQIAMKFSHMIRPFFDDREEYYEVNSAFQMALVSDALLRMDYLKTEPSISQFHLQAMSLILFLIISIVSVFMTTLTANQLTAGGMRRLKVRGVGFLDVWIAKAIIVIVLSTILCLVASLFFFINDISFSIIRLILSTIFMAAVIHMICMVFTIPKYKTHVASTRAMLGCIAMLLLMLFAGGGFYPIYLMDFSIKLFNPAWLAHLLTEWTISGTPISIQNVLLFMLPAIICALLSLKKWREVL